jgi:hypothetical protein
MDVELGFSSTVVCGAPVKDHNLNNREEKVPKGIK